MQGCRYVCINYDGWAKKYFKNNRTEALFATIQKQNGAPSGNLVWWSHEMAFLLKTTKILGKKKCNLLKSINELGKI